MSISSETQRRLLFRIAAVIACIGMPQVAAARDPLKPPVSIKLGIIGALYDAPALIARERGYMREEGLEIEVMVFKNGPDALQTLSVGSIDAVATGASVAPFNARLRGIDMTVVAGAGVHSPGRGTIGFAVRKDLLDSGRYKSPADLKGLKIVAPPDNPPRWMVVEMARRAGVDPGSITFVSMGFSNVLAAFANKAVDAGAANEPLATAMARQGGAVTVATIDQVKPGFPAGYLVYGALLTKRSREAGNRFMVGYLRGVRDYLAAYGPGAKDRAAIETMLKKHDVAAGEGAAPLDISPDGAASFAHVQDFLKWHLELGTIRTMPDIKSVLDDSFRQWALKAIQGK